MPARLDNSATPEHAIKMIASGILRLVKQHSSLHASIHSLVSSSWSQSAQKVVNDRMYGTSRAMLANRVRTLIIKKMNPRDFLMWEMPIIMMAMKASRSDSIPTTKPRMCGRGPLNSREIHTIIAEIRNIEENRKKVEVMQARPTAIPGTLPIETDCCVSAHIWCDL